MRNSMNEMAAELTKLLGGVVKTAAKVGSKCDKCGEEKCRCVCGKCDKPVQECMCEDKANDAPKPPAPPATPAPTAPQAPQAPTNAPTTPPSPEKKAGILSVLVKLANTLDEAGDINAASMVDDVLKSLAGKWEKDETDFLPSGYQTEPIWVGPDYKTPKDIPLHKDVDEGFEDDGPVTDSELRSVQGPIEKDFDKPMVVDEAPKFNDSEKEEMIDALLNDPKIRELIKHKLSM